MAASPASGADVLEIGYVSGIHGLRGDLLIKLHYFQSDVLYETQELMLRTRSGQTMTVTLVDRLERGKKGYQVRFREVRNRTEAEPLKGATVLVPRDTIAALAPDEFYLEDLRGLTAIDADTQRKLGVIDSFLTTNIELVYVVSPQGDGIYLPLLDGTVKQLDLDARVVHLSIPEGLLE